MPGDIINWKSGDILVYTKVIQFEYTKNTKIGDKFILCNDYNFYDNMLYIRRPNETHKLSIRKSELNAGFININEQRENKINEVLK